MTDFFDAVERQLVNEAHRRAARHRPYVPRTRSAALVAVVLLVLVGAPALAAVTGAWNPFAGLARHHNPPSTTLSPPPPAMLRAFGVLRRPQTAAERNPEALRAAYLWGGKDVAGVHLAHIRRLPGSAETGYLYIVPVDRIGLESYREAKALLAGHPSRVEFEARLRGPGAESYSHAIRSARKGLATHRLDPQPGICVIDSPPAALGGGGGCAPLSLILSGRDFSSAGHTAYSIVPDGVARVEARYGHRTIRARVRDNFYLFHAPDSRGPGEITWYSAAGRRLKVVRFRH